MAVPVNGSGTEFEGGSAKPLFEVPPSGRPLRHIYDVTADGERFLVNLSSPEPEASSFALVVDWLAAVKH